MKIPPSLPQQNVSYTNQLSAGPSPDGAAGGALPLHFAGADNAPMPEGANAAPLEQGGANADAHVQGHAAAGAASQALLADASSQALRASMGSLTPRAPRPLATTPSALQSLVDENMRAAHTAWRSADGRHQGRSLLATLSRAFHTNGEALNEGQIHDAQTTLNDVVEMADGCSPALVLLQQTAMLSALLDDDARYLRVCIDVPDTQWPDDPVAVVDAAIVFNVDAAQDAPEREVSLYRFALDASQQFELSAMTFVVAGMVTRQADMMFAHLPA